MCSLFVVYVYCWLETIQSNSMLKMNGLGSFVIFFCVLYYYCLKWIWLCVHHKSHTLHELNHLILIMIINTFSSLFTRVYSFYYVFFLQSFLPIVQLSDFFTIQSIGFWFMRVCWCVCVFLFLCLLSKHNSI